ncbi:uncharacterized protein LOC144627224 isoform X2 [Crassostrea virginica]
MLIQEQVTNFKMTRLHRFLLFVLNIFVTLLVTLPVEGFYRTTAVPPVYCYKKQTPYSYSTKYRCDGYIRNPWTSKTAYDSCPSRARCLTSPPTYSSYGAPSRVLAPHTASILQWTNAKST